MCVCGGTQGVCVCRETRFVFRCVSVEGHYVCGEGHCVCVQRSTIFVCEGRPCVGRDTCVCVCGESHAMCVCKERHIVCVHVCVWRDT